MRALLTSRQSLLFASCALFTLATPLTPNVTLSAFALWSALILFFIFLQNAPPAKATLAGLLVGTCYGFAVLAPLGTLIGWWWVMEGTLMWEYRHAILWVFIGALATASGGLFFALFSFLYTRFKTNTLYDAGVFALIWVLLELIREWLVLGFTWGIAGYALVAHPWLLPLAVWVGAYGLSALLVASAVLAAQWWAHPKGKAPYALTALLVSAHVLGAAVYYGHEAPVGEPLAVAALASPYTTQEGESREALAFHLDLLERALIAGADVVLLPENIFPLLLFNRETQEPRLSLTRSRITELDETLRALSEAHPDAQIVFGSHAIDGENTYNSLVVLSRGTYRIVYDKVVLMPFGEWSPSFIARGHIGAFTPGATQTFLLGTHTASARICSEIVYPRTPAHPPVALILNSANDGIFRSSAVGRWHDSMARFRAVEQRAYVVRSVKGGRASIIDARGKVLSSAEDIAQVTLFRQ